jgi:hypothetical protein
MSGKSGLNALLSGALGYVPVWLAFYGTAWLVRLDSLAIAVGTMLLVPFYIAVRYGAR